MAGRYLITGVQLGMLIAFQEQPDREILAKKIEDKQFLGNSNNPIEADCVTFSKIMEER